MIIANDRQPQIEKHTVDENDVCNTTFLPDDVLVIPSIMTVTFGWLHGTVVERWSSTGELSLSCARPTADG